MTVEEYDRTAFTGGMEVLVNDKWYEVAMADFEVKTFGLEIKKKIKWFPCEAIKEVRYRDVK